MATQWPRTLKAHEDLFIVADGYSQHMAETRPNLDRDGFPQDGDTVIWSGGVEWLGPYAFNIALHVYHKRTGQSAIIPARFLFWSPF